MSEDQQQSSPAPAPPPAPEPQPAAPPPPPPPPDFGTQNVMGQEPPLNFGEQIFMKGGLPADLEVRIDKIDERG